MCKYTKEQSIAYFLGSDATSSESIKHGQNLANILASPQVTDEQIYEIAKPFGSYCELSGIYEFDHQGFARALLALSTPPAAETPKNVSFGGIDFVITPAVETSEVPYNLRSQFEKFMVLWSEHLYGAPVDTDKKQDEDLGLTYKSQFMAGAWFIWQSVSAGAAQLPEGSLPMLPAASQFVHGYSESQMIDFAGKVLAIAAAPQEAETVAAALETALTVFDMGLGFALCHRDFEDTRNAIKKLQADFTAIRTMLAAAAQEQAPSGSAALNVLRNIIEDGYLSETNMHRGRRILDGSQEQAPADKDAL